ncbi:MAG: indole-3-glycerol phosphate synthase TrpC [Kiritimatiellae bacterium]|nr:indole-3-glycerol phosphate synthase TrpC [Kiritimatiellia bacterium]
MDILEELSALRRADAEEAAKAVPYGALEKRIAEMPAPRDFRAAFAGPGIHVIAELKKASPSEGLIRPDFDPAAIARTYAANGAAAMSVLCEPHRFLGGEAYLKTVRATVETPLIYKDFLTTDYQVAAARAAGADACLLIAAVLDDAALGHLLGLAHAFGLTALVETHTEEEVRRAVGVGAKLIGVNCRDLRTFRTDPAITAELVAKIPSGVTRIGESGIKTHADILKVKAAGADGFLIGTTLMRAPDPGAKLRELVG